MSENIAIINNNDLKNVINDNELRNVYENQQITIKKPDLKGNSKWKCYWQGKKSFNIKDEIFLKQISNGLIIGSQTVLIVNLEVISSLDNNSKIIEKSEIYNVLKVSEIKNLSSNNNFNS